MLVLCSLRKGIWVNRMYLVISRGFLETGTENILALFGMGGLAGGSAVWEGGT